MSPARSDIVMSVGLGDALFGAHLLFIGIAPSCLSPNPTYITIATW